MALNLAEVQRRTRELATIIDAPESCLPTMGHTEDFARPYVEVVGPLLHYVVVERGQELLRESFQELEELLFRVFKDVTFQMAAMFELRNRRPSEDSRRLLFARQLELLSLLSPRWGDRERAGLCEVLKQHPFGDEVQPRDSLP